MKEDYRLSKIGILIQQQKFSEAEKILKDLLSVDANDIYLLSLLAEVNWLQDKNEIAKEIINNAIGISPDSPHLFYVKSRISIQLKDYDEAESNIKRAIELDPFDAHYFALYANIKLTRKQYEEALGLANKSLAIDAENLLGLNTRSTALLKLNKSEESFHTIEGALREDPNNAFTHANYGWGLLEKGDHKKALEHFKLSLKSEPSFGYAQSGMLEAIKASNPIYRLFLKYSFWMSNLTAKYQWGVIIGFYLGTKLLRLIAANNEVLKPYLTPLIIFLGLVAFSTWIINPISNLFLRFNKYGQLLLDKSEKMSSNFVALGLVTFVIGGVLYFTMADEKFLTVAVFGFAMILPFSMMFLPSKYKHSLLIYSIVMAVVGLAAIGITFASGEIYNILTLVFVFGFVAFQWIANYLTIKADNR